MTKEKQKKLSVRKVGRMLLSYYFFVGDRRPWRFGKPMDLTERLKVTAFRGSLHKLMTAIKRVQKGCAPHCR